MRARLVSLAILLAAALPAQNFVGRIRIKPLVPPISQPWKPTQPAARPSFSRPAEDSRPCSIPLTNVLPRDIDADVVVAPPPAQSYMPIVTPPAPPCGEKPRR